jgi:hypothetical protein
VLVFYNMITNELWLYNEDKEFATQGEYDIFYKFFLDWTEAEHWVYLGEL